MTMQEGHMDSRLFGPASPCLAPPLLESGQGSEGSTGRKRRSGRGSCSLSLHGWTYSKRSGLWSHGGMCRACGICLVHRGLWPASGRPSQSESLSCSLQPKGGGRQGGQVGRQGELRCYRQTAKCGALWCVKCSWGVRTSLLTITG